MFKKIRYALPLLSLILTGCWYGQLPDQEVALESFVPGEELQTSNTKITQDFTDFTGKHFPGDCRWVTLVRVEDGDTIVVQENEVSDSAQIISGKRGTESSIDERVRLVGVDTPESKHPDKPIQKGSLEATDFLSSLLAGQEEVCLIADPVGDTQDKYNRTLAYLYTREGVDCARELLIQGYARHYGYFPFARQDEFAYYQQVAKDTKIGLWR